MGLFYLTGTDFSAMSTLNYAAQVPIGLYIMGIALFCYLVYNVVRFVNDAKRRASFVRKVKLKVDDLTFELSGYVDSGNFLMQDGLPVCFVFDRRVKKHVSEVLAGSLMSTDKHCRERFKTIFFDTVGGKKQKAYAFRPDVFEVDDQAADVYVALGGKNFHGAKPQFDVLLNSVLAEK